MWTIPTIVSGITLGVLIGASLFAPLAAQGPVPGVPGFDADRAILNDRPWFDPFHVTERNVKRLADALAASEVEEETPVLVLARDGQRVALLTTQMSYHHVAQGQLAGEPWLVTF